MPPPGVPKRKTTRAPPVDKLLKPAIGVVLALVAYNVFQGMSLEIPRLDVDDALLLREVFFGEGAEAAAGKSATSGAGKKHSNYAVLCHPKEAEGGGPGLPVSSVFQDAYKDGSAPAEFFLLDCNHVLEESGKTIAERFDLNLKKRPTIFVSGQVGPPKQIPDKHLKTGAMLTKALKNALETNRTIKIETTKDLKTKCLAKQHCALLLKGGSGKVDKFLRDAMQSLMANYVSKGVVFATIDASLLLVSGLEEYLPETSSSGQHRFVVFDKVSGSLSLEEEKKDNKKGRLITSIAPHESTNLSFSSMNALLRNVVSKKAGATTKIPALPTIKTRTKKLEEQLNEKRQRRMQQQQQQSQGSSSSSRSASSTKTFTANDGSKEGRRLERERRRAEHYAQNNVKPKTPEEIKEMERKRRLRMEEEAAKWNMEAADEEEDGAEEESGAKEQDEESTTTQEEYYEERGQDDEEEEEEEEDEEVMDLD